MQQQWCAEVERSPLYCTDSEGDDSDLPSTPLDKSERVRRATAEADEEPEQSVGPAATRAKVRALEEAEYNVLIRSILLAAERHRVSQVCSDLLAACSLSFNDNTSSGSEVYGTKPLVLEVPYHDVHVKDPDDDEDDDDDRFAVLLPSVRKLSLNGYMGPKQMLVLADVLTTCESPSEASVPDGRKAPGENGPRKNYSLFPFLEELHLCGLTLRFGKVDCPTWLSESHTAYMTLFRALRGHPSLRLLDLSGSGVGPALLPDLQKLIKQTKTLCAVNLAGTLLSEGECELIRAQCTLNALRLENNRRAAAESEGVIQDSWLRGLYQWLQTVASRIMSPVACTTAFPLARNSGVTTAVKVVAHVRSACTETEVQELAYALYGRRRRKPSHHPEDWRHDESREGTVSERRERKEFAHLRKANTPSSDGVGADDVAWEADADGSVSEASDVDDWDETCDSDATAITPILTLPHVHYRLAADNHYVLSRSCMDVIHSAFRDPEEVRRGRLGGRPVPEGVPGPLFRLGGAFGFPSRRHREALKADMAASALLTAVRRTLFPPPPKPKSIFGPHYANPDLRTTAEENYYATLATQEAQWDALLEALVLYVRPAYIYPAEQPSDESGEPPSRVVYVPGGVPYWLSFLPHADPAIADAVAEVNLRYPKCDGSSSTEVLTLKEGEFFGEVDLLGGTAYHTDTVALLERSLITRKLIGGTLKTVHIAKQLQKNRQGSARVVLSHPEATSLEGPAGARSPYGKGGSLCDRGGPCMLWQLPLEVVHFFLSEPYEQWQAHVASSLRMSQTGGGGLAITPAVCPTLACFVEPHVITRRYSQNRLEHDEAFFPRASRGTTEHGHGGSETDVVADGPALEETLFFLQAGEYTLYTLTSKGKWTERPLLPGQLLIGEQSFALDEAARQKLRQQNSSASDGRSAASVAAGSTTVGKDAALRQFREAKRRARMAAAENQCETAAGSSSSPLQADGCSGKSQGSPAATATIEGEQVLCIGRAGSSVATGTWRYFTMSSKRFAGLPESTRLALTANAVVVDRLP